MSAHRSDKRPASRSRRGRGVALLSLVAVAFLATGMSVKGTFASWNDSGTVTGGTFSSGTLDITVDGAQGKPTAYAKTNLALAAMVPGESAASTLSIANVGNADFTWVATASTGGDLGPALTVQMYLNSTDTGDDATYPRTEGCSGGTLITSGSTATRLNRAATQNVCVVVSLPTSTGDAFQGKTTGSVSISLVATQVLAP